MKFFEVKDLKMFYSTPKGFVKAVNGVSFELDRGETLGIAGESGCGKTSIALSIIRILPENGKYMGGKIMIDGLDILNLPEDEMRKIRWKKISIIFQGAMNAFNPVKSIGDQTIEALKIHDKMTKEEMKEKVASVFRNIGLDPSRMNNYPHELSGGMKQRAMIAMSLICNPQLIIADEPTTALDVILQDQILDEIKKLQEKFKLAMIYITHDISVLAETCDKIAIMYGGKIMELADTISVFKKSHHPYTMALINAFPSVRGPLKRLKTIGGAPPDLLSPTLGCLFEPRCPFSKDICKKEDPPSVNVNKGHYSKCHFALDFRIQKNNMSIEV